MYWVLLEGLGKALGEYVHGKTERCLAPWSEVTVHAFLPQISTIPSNSLIREAGILTHPTQRFGHTLGWVGIELRRLKILQINNQSRPTEC